MTRSGWRSPESTLLAHNDREGWSERRAWHVHPRARPPPLGTAAPAALREVTTRSSLLLAAPAFSPPPRPSPLCSALPQTCPPAPAHQTPTQFQGAHCPLVPLLPCLRSPSSRSQWGARTPAPWALHFSLQLALGLCLLMTQRHALSPTRAAAHLRARGASGGTRLPSAHRQLGRFEQPRSEQRFLKPIMYLFMSTSLWGQGG